MLLGETQRAIGGAPAGQEIASVALEAFSEGDGPPLVMLGGGTLGAGEFAGHARILAADFQVVRLQNLNIERALKRQPLPAGYSIKAESAAMVRSLDRLGLRQAVDVVGHSFGALVALDFALDHPDRVRTLILAEPPAFWVVPPDELLNTPEMRTMVELSRTLGPTIDPTDDQYVQFLAALGIRGVKPPAPTDPAWRTWVLRRSTLRGLSAVSDHTDKVGRLKKFRRPVLIVTGSRTVSFHRRIDDILAASLPLAERAELEGDHGAPARAKQEFVNTIKAFLARHR
jgi:pimeloyl-ACP methyl ester carboxylesterase